MREINLNLTAVDLFAGAGGLSLGFEQAGFKILLGIEKDPYAAETYKQNRKKASTIVLAEDVIELDSDKLLRILKMKKGEIDILMGGPPCQGFSISNMRTRTLNNPKNLLYKEFVRYVKDLKPRWFLLENVSGMDIFKGGLVRDVIMAEMKTAGYACESRIVNAASYGVPQIRRRIFIVGNRIGVDFKFPIPSHGNGGRAYMTVWEAISDLPPLENGHNKDAEKYKKNGREITNYQKIMRKGWRKQYCLHNLVSKNNGLVLNRYRFIPPGGNWEDIPEYLMGNYRDKRRCHSGIYRRLQWDELSVVVSNFRKNMLIHPEQDRGLSVREAARLQSFPDWYVFYGPLGAQQQQVANAVPPLLARKIANSILKSSRKKTNA